MLPVTRQALSPITEETGADLEAERADSSALLAVETTAPTPEQLAARTEIQDIYERLVDAGYIYVPTTPPARAPGSIDISTAPLARAPESIDVPTAPLARAPESIDTPTTPLARAQGPSLFGRFISGLQELPFRVILACDRVVSYMMNFCFFTLNLIGESNIEIYRALTRQTPQTPQTPPKPPLIQRV